MSSERRSLLSEFLASIAIKGGHLRGDEPEVFFEQPFHVPGTAGVVEEVDFALDEMLAARILPRLQRPVLVNVVRSPGYVPVRCFHCWNAGRCARGAEVYGAFEVSHEGRVDVTRTGCDGFRARLATSMAGARVSADVQVGDGRRRHIARRTSTVRGRDLGRGRVQTGDGRRRRLVAPDVDAESIIGLDAVPRRPGRPINKAPCPPFGTIKQHVLARDARVNTPPRTDSEPDRSSSPDSSWPTPPRRPCAPSRSSRRAP